MGYRISSNGLHLQKSCLNFGHAIIRNQTPSPTNERFFQSIQKVETLDLVFDEYSFAIPKVLILLQADSTPIKRDPHREP